MAASARSRSSSLSIGVGASVVVEHESVVKSGQEVRYAALVTLSPAASHEAHRLRVLVRADSYRAQSWSRVERWDGQAWQEVWSVPGEALLVEEKIAYRAAPATVADFAADAAAVLARAAQVLAPAVRS